MIFAGVLGVAAGAAHADQDVTKIRRKFDLREAILRRFFRDNHCPAERLAGVFVAEADAHGLDWRLLPSLAFVESGAGKFAKGNNVFGWANGKTRFDSVSDAIHQVAAALSLGQAYRDKDTGGKLLTYNKKAGYKSTVMAVMNRISATADVSAPLPAAE